MRWLKTNQFAVRKLKEGLLSYHRRHISLPRAARIGDAAVQLLKPRLPVGARLLDVGCGDGSIGLSVATALGAAAIEGVDVLLQDDCAIAVQPYDGRRLPFADKAMDAVLLSDVLHHAAEPQRLLGECMRVASRAVMVKDHFAYGPLSQSLLWAMDLAGNAKAGVAVTGRYFSPAQWVQMVEQCGGRMTNLRWPLCIHDLPWRLLTRSELQFAALVVPAAHPTTCTDAAPAAAIHAGEPA